MERMIEKQNVYLIFKHIYLITRLIEEFSAVAASWIAAYGR